MKAFALALTCAVLAGCAQTNIGAGKLKFSTRRLAAAAKLGPVTYLEETLSGTNVVSRRELKIQSVDSDLVSGFKAGIQAAQTLKP